MLKFLCINRGNQITKYCTQHRLGFKQDLCIKVLPILSGLYFNKSATFKAVCHDTKLKKNTLQPTVSLPPHSALSYLNIGSLCHQEDFDNLNILVDPDSCFNV